MRKTPPPAPSRRGEGSQRRFGIALLLLATVAVIALAGCGSKGNPPALASPVQVALVASDSSTAIGQATLTPAYGTHVVVYMHGDLIPYADPQTPAQLRQGSCYGPVVAPLTANAPTGTGGSKVEVRADAQKGANVAHAVDPNWYVVVLESTATNAKEISCGHPLSERRQYFDLYEPAKVDQGVGLGIALFESIIITEVHVSLTKAMPQAAQWSIHSGGCHGSTLASGAIAAGATTASGSAFAPLDTKSWWLAITPNGASAPAACVKAG